ncbi:MULTISPECIES: hypothetical protein [unclassified Afipia]|uniref:hypothetical protein n=1 Tax=unclassified Afipia TaxID=2642050 RepID=UPI0003FB3048|nr:MULTISPECIES: hypothetical protein [unclassified Afipia]
MASLGSYSFRDPEGNTYSLEMDLDDAAMMEDAVSVAITGKKEYAVTKTTISVEFSVTLETSEKPKPWKIVIRHGDMVVGTIPLPEFGPPEDVAYDALPDEAWNHLSDLVDNPNALEHAIAAIPAGDPILGCLIKAAVSTSVGQILRCYKEHRESPDWRAVTRKVLRCLGAHSARMLMTAIWRTGKCAVLAGFG